MGDSIDIGDVMFHVKHVQVALPLEQQVTRTRHTLKSRDRGVTVAVAFLES
jgi:hypothetical protein